MGGEKIHLPNFLIADLYKSNLVDIRDNYVSKQKASIESAGKNDGQVDNKLSFLGQNKKVVTVIVNDANATHLNEADYAFLINILKACNLAPDDIAIINAASQLVEFKAVNEQLSPEFLLLFGIDATAIQLPVSATAFAIEKSGDTIIMCCPPLTEMNTSTAASIALKRQLWTALKQMFAI